MDIQALERLKSLVLPNVRESVYLALSKFVGMLDGLGLEFDGESKRYLGHLVAQVLRKLSGLTYTGKGDATFEGFQIEIKHTVLGNWMIGPENIDGYGLLIKTDLNGRTFSDTVHSRLSEIGIRYCFS